ncbi:uncharacterized protein TNCV_3153361 [Trichonephila clavipes]|nr:uncharacterized protein TNCV_3153361 [Trichonephila clavipes]
MNTVHTLFICLLWICTVFAEKICPQWGTNSPCTCSVAQNGLMVQCTGPAQSEQLTSALESMPSGEDWDLQLEHVDVEELPPTVRTVSSLRLSNCNIGRLQRVTPLVWPKLNEVVFESLRMRDDPWTQLKGAHSLKSIKVSDFPMMRTIDQNFRGVSNSVEYLDIRKTGTTRLESGAMSHLKNLRYVFIADMPLSEFPREALPDELSQLHTFILGLAKEARDIEHKCTTITLDDANAVAKHRIMNHTFKKPLVTEFDCPRIITSTIARLRTEHLKGMEIHPDKTRSYVHCKHCPDLQLTPNHILECPTAATKLLKMGMVPLRDSL